MLPSLMKLPDNVCGQTISLVWALVAKARLDFIVWRESRGSLAAKCCKSACFIDWNNNTAAVAGESLLLRERRRAEVGRTHGELVPN